MSSSQGLRSGPAKQFHREVDTEDVGVTGRSEPPAAEVAREDPATEEPAAPAIRRRARGTRLDAKALTAQAEHQTRRARRNLAAARKNSRARVLVVDDSPAFVDAAASLVSAAPSLRLVGVAGSGEEAIELLPLLKPDFVLLDFRLPGMDGVEAARLIGEARPEAVVVLVSAEPEHVEPAGRAAGAVDVLGKRQLSPARLEALWAQHMPGP